MTGNTGAATACVLNRRQTQGGQGGTIGNLGAAESAAARENARISRAVTAMTDVVCSDLDETMSLRSSSKQSSRANSKQSSSFISRANVEEAFPMHADQPETGANSPDQPKDDLQRGNGRKASVFSNWSRSANAGDGQNCAADLLGSPVFDVGIGLVIVANSVTIGMEQTQRLNGQDTSTVEMIEHVFLSIYIVEIATRLYAKGWQVFQDNWVRFDLLLVLVGIATGWIINPLFGGSDELGPLMMLRTLRLLRLAKAVRLFVQFRELWMLVSGLLGSCRTMLYTLLLLFTMLYIFSCISIEMITNNPIVTDPEGDPDFKAVVAANFGSLPMAMLTFVQFICFDNIVYIYKPLIMADMKLALFFIAVILIMGIALMNLVTAVIVNSALEQAIQDKDLMKADDAAKRKKIVNEMRKIFIRLDVDGSGEVSREEIQSISAEDKKVLSSLMMLGDPIDIFDALDIDGSGDIGIDEFIDGIWQVVISNTPIEMKRMEKQIEIMRKQLNDTQVWQDEVGGLLSVVLTELRGHKSNPRHMPAVAVEEPRPVMLDSDKRAGPVAAVGAAAINGQGGEGFVPPWAEQLLDELHKISLEDIQRNMDEVRVSIERQGLHLELHASTQQGPRKPQRPGARQEAARRPVLKRVNSTPSLTLPQYKRGNSNPRLMEGLPEMHRADTVGTTLCRNGGFMGGPPRLPAPALGEHAAMPEVPSCKQPILLAPEIGRDARQKHHI